MLRQDLYKIADDADLSPQLPHPESHGIYVQKAKPLSAEEPSVRIYSFPGSWLRSARR